MSDAQVFGGFHDELTKVAVDLHRVLGNAGALGGAGALAGAAGGALLGGVRNYRQARSRGEGVAQGFAEGTAGALRGAGRGALLGAGVGAAAGALAPTAIHEGLAQAKGPLGAGARFGQRQVHAFTGWLPGKGDPSSLERIRGGAYDARAGLNRAEKEVAAGGGRSAEKAVSRARAGLAGAEDAQRMGLTSIPGYARSLRDAPLKTLQKGMAQQWHSGGAAMKALTIGLPAMSTVGALRAPEQATGPGKGERVGRELASAVGGVVTAPLPFLPGQVVSSGLGRAGGLVGRGVDRLRGRRGDLSQHAIAPENVTGQHIPTERVTSPSMAGQAPEGAV